ncbi:MAG: tetratricopeptide repeat protein [candidate division NC10 bacterium]|nr:tetratricopeptide repeat protein [candidate division NC10 bacterium]
MRNQGNQGKTPSIQLLIVAAIVIVYANALGNGFVFDDVGQIVENQNLRSFSQVKMAFLKALPFGGAFNEEHAAFYRPLFWTSLFLDRMVWGLDPFGYHLTNIFLHLLVALLIFSLVRRLFKEEVVASLVSLLWALHPIQTEVAAYISSRMASLSALFSLLAFHLFFMSETGTRLKRGGALGGAVLSFTFALLSYEMAVTSPLLMAVLDASRESWGTRAKGPLRRAFRYVPFLVALAVYFLLRFTRFPFGGPMTVRGFLDGFSTRFLSIPLVFIGYLKLLLFPLHLSVERSTFIPHPQTLLDPEVVLSVTVIGLLLFTAWRTRASWPGISVGILWFFTALLPVSNIVPVYNRFAERFVYLPSLGLIMGACFAGSALARRAEAFRKGTVVAVLLVLLLFSARTILRNRDYQDNETIYLATLAVSPKSFLIQANLGNVYLRQSRFDFAFERFRETLRLKPDDPSALNGLAVVYIHRGHLDLAKTVLRAALQADPRSFAAHANLGLIHRQEGHLDLALEAFQRAVALNPGHAGALVDLGGIYLALGQREEAAALFRRALSSEPGFPPAEEGLKETGEPMTKQP